MRLINFIGKFVMNVHIFYLGLWLRTDNNKSNKHSKYVDRIVSILKEKSIKINTRKHEFDQILIMFRFNNFILPYCLSPIRFEVLKAL